AHETMPLIAARKPWFCMSIADFTPARCAPAEMPTPSSSLASRTSVISGSSSAMRIRCTSHVSGSAEISRTPLALRASYTTRELAVETGDTSGGRGLLLQLLDQAPKRHDGVGLRHRDLVVGLEVEVFERGLLGQSLHGRRNLPHAVRRRDHAVPG